MMIHAIFLHLCWFILEVIGVFFVLAVWDRLVSCILWGLLLPHGYGFLMVILIALGYLLVSKNIKNNLIAVNKDSFIARAVTSTVLLIALGVLYFYTSPCILSTVIICIYAYAFLVEYLSLMRSKNMHNFIISPLVGIALLATGIAHSIWVLHITSHPYLFICIAAAILSDMGGYCIGNIFGQHAFVPSISPKKTWEGFVGSILFTSIGFYVYVLYSATYSPFFFTALGVVLAIAAVGGDLLFSYLKRQAGVKDTGTILPGHGGILDRLDSIIGTTIAGIFLLLLTI